MQKEMYTLQTPISDYFYFLWKLPCVHNYNRDYGVRFLS